MSIISIRKAMEAKGCQVILVLVGVALAAGMILSMFAGGGPMGGDGQGQDPVVFTVGERKITLDQFNERMQLMSQNQQTPQGTAVSELTNSVTAIQGFVEESANLALAKEKGLTINDSNLQTVAETISKQFLEQYRFQLIQAGQIKPDATKEEADKIMTQFLGGKTPDAMVKEQVDEIVTKYKDPKTKQDIVGALIPTLLQESYEKNTTYTEEDLKKSYEEYTFNVIRFDDLSKGLTEREDAALAALDKIKGGTDFAAVQKEYAPNAKAEDKTLSLTVGLMETSSDLKDLKNLKVGEVSEVVNSNGSPTIYKLEKVKPNLPPSFEESKAMLLESNRTSRARQQLQEDQKAKVEGLQPKFEDKGLQIAYEVSRDFNKPEYASDPAKLKDLLEAKKAEIRDPEFSSMYFPNLVAATEFIITEYLYNEATAEEKKEMIDDRIESARNMLANFEDNGFRLQFASELLNSDRADDAFTFALNAAENNGDYEISGQNVNDQIQALTSQAVADKKWTAEQEAQINAELKRWQDDRQQYLADQKEIEEANKKAQEELDKETVKPNESTEGDTSKSTETTPENPGN